MFIGIVGYSGTKFDQSKGQSLVVEAFDDLETRFGKDLTIVSGLTMLGIPAMAYKEASKRGFKTVGIACKKAKNYECFECDEIIIVGNKWGDESETFLNKINGLSLFCLI